MVAVEVCNYTDSYTPGIVNITVIVVAEPTAGSNQLSSSDSNDDDTIDDDTSDDHVAADEEGIIYIHSAVYYC